MLREYGTVGPMTFLFSPVTLKPAMTCYPVENALIIRRPLDEAKTSNICDIFGLKDLTL